MNQREYLDAFHKALDDDKGLKSKRQMVVYVALITLALTLSGTTIEEANTFLFKLKFSTPEGLLALLFIANIFFFIRYQNYSAPYDEKIKNIYHLRLLNDKRVCTTSVFSNRNTGLLDLLLLKIGKENLSLDEKVDIKETRYSSKFLLKRYIETELIINSNENNMHTISHSIFKEIGFLKYLKLLYVELDVKINTMINHREILDISAPRLISIASFLSVLNRDKLHAFTSLFSIVPQ